MTTINFPALGETPVHIEPYLPDTIDLQGGTTRPYGVMVNGTVFVSRATFAQLKTGSLDLVVQDLGTISLEPFSFDHPFQLRFQLRSRPEQLNTSSSEPSR